MDSRCYSLCVVGYINVGDGNKNDLFTDGTRMWVAFNYTAHIRKWVGEPELVLTQRDAITHPCLDRIILLASQGGTDLLVIEEEPAFMGEEGDPTSYTLSCLAQYALECGIGGSGKVHLN